MLIKCDKFQGCVNNGCVWKRPVYALHVLGDENWVNKIEKNIELYGHYFWLCHVNKCLLIKA